MRGCLSLFSAAAFAALSPRLQGFFLINWKSNTAEFIAVFDKVWVKQVQSKEAT